MLAKKWRPSLAAIVCRREVKRLFARLEPPPRHGDEAGAISATEFEPSYLTVFFSKDFQISSVRVASG
jgi:hypothetical protein